MNGSLGDARDPILVLSEELAAAGVEHRVKVVPCNDSPLYSIEGVTRLRSAIKLAAACERAGFDAVYSAGSGWQFVTSIAEYKRRAAAAMEKVRPTDG